MFFPTLEEILQSEEKLIKLLPRGWRWTFFPGYYEATAVFKQIQELDLYDIFEEKSLFRSDYQVQITINGYFKYQGRRHDTFVIGFYLMNNDNKHLASYHWETQEEKWTRVVLTQTVSLKDVRYLKFFQDMSFKDFATLDPVYPFGTYLPRATLKFQSI